MKFVMKERKFNAVLTLKPGFDVSDERFKEVNDFLNCKIDDKKHLDLCNNGNNSKGLLEKAINSINQFLINPIDLWLINSITSKDSLKDFIVAIKDIGINGVMPPLNKPSELEEVPLQKVPSLRTAVRTVIKPTPQKSCILTVSAKVSLTRKPPFSYFNGASQSEIDKIKKENKIKEGENKKKIEKWQSMQSSVQQCWDENKEAIEKFLKYVREIAKLEYQSLITDKIGDLDIDVTVAKKKRDASGKIIEDATTKKTIYENPVDKGYKYANFGSFKLWSNDSNQPVVEDIKQGRIGDCYLLATLISLVKKDAESVKRCFINRDTLDADKYAKLRFFKVNVKEISDKIVAEPMEEVIVQVDKTVLISPNDKSQPEKLTSIDELVYNKKEALWVNIFEKAFTLYKSKAGNVFSGVPDAQYYVDQWYDFRGAVDGKKNSVTNFR
jgi:hypothetical protein